MLTDVVQTTAETGDLAVVLDRLAGLTLDATDADRVSFFLFDEGREAITLWAARSRHPDPDLWQRGVSMPAIAIAGDAARWAAVERGQPIAIRDASTSPLIPPEWVRAFSLTSLVATPIRSGPEIFGILVVDWRVQRDVSDETVRVVGAIGQATGLAVGNARLSADLAVRATRMERLVAATHALASLGSLVDVADHVADAITDILDATQVSVHLLEGDGPQYRTLMQRGVALPEAGDLRRLSSRALARVARAWRPDRVARPVVFTDIRGIVEGDFVPEGVGCVLVLPLAVHGHGVFGFVLVGLAHATPPARDLMEVASALAGHIAVAVNRSRLHEHVALGAEFARALLTLHDLAPDGAGGLLARVRDAVPAALGFRITDVLVASEHASLDRVNSSTPFEAKLWRSWQRRRTQPPVVVHHGMFYAPIWVGGRMRGALCAVAERMTPGRHERSLLEGLASALGESIERQDLRQLIFRRDAALAVAQERSEAVNDVHRVIGGALGVVSDAASALSIQLAEPQRSDAGRIAALAHAAHDELQRIGALLGVLTYDEEGFEATLAGVVDDLAGHLDLAADLAVRGTPRPLPLPVQRALLRVLHEGLARVEYRSRSYAVAVRLEFHAEEVELLIRDDGVDLATRDGAPLPSTHFGLRVIQRRLEELGGRVVIERPPPRGLLLRASVPA